MPLALVADPAATPSAERPEGAAAVLRAALEHGPVGRGEISRATRLSPAAVSRYAAELLALGLVREPVVANSAPRPGRPSIPLEIDTERHLVAGVHVAVPQITLALADLRGRVVARRQVAREPGGLGAERDLRVIAAELPGFLRREAAGRSVLGVGAVTGGWVDPELGMVVENSALGWQQVPLGRELASVLGLPVHVEGHARALARAEMLFGAKHSGELVHLFVGNVVDAAIVAGGVPVRGRQGGAGGVAHLPVPGSELRCPCGRVGCLQVTVSDRAVAERAVAAGIVERPDLRLVLGAARAGDRRALELCRARLRTVGYAARLLLDMLGPEELVVTEAVTVYLPELLPVLREAAADRAGVVRASSFGLDALAVAATAPVLAAIHQDPLGLRTVATARVAGSGGAVGGRR
ncbi:hypothetical protein CFP65_7444 [Kitasatospora sp. MMS16-BH015]|uniref:ROK family protein n=1 Tax=Kitasatospora sp. MMS16-BH015 TaxID=2018025 RepID=UPI000CA11DA9|nr:ROK family protein [Kitasatospora sp. MMS16-BH015]AUG82024.1 hypothetical protein CFP65_7444 [Kitasatospora sp. MMS16-BH015]